MRYAALLATFLALSAFAGDVEIGDRPYGLATTINFCLPDYDSPTDFETAATFSAGDVTIRKDSGTETNVATLPTDRGSCYDLPLSATEMQADRIQIVIADQDATKVWADTSINIETYGASGLHDAVSWLAQCEDQDGTYTCQEIMSVLFSALAGVCTYTSGTRTLACQDPSGTETRFTMVLGTALDGDIDSSTVTPFTP